MSGLSNQSFVGGLMQGADFVQGMQAKQQAMGLQHEQNQRVQESHAMQMELGRMRVHEMTQEQQQKATKAMAWSAYSAKEAPEEYRKILAAHPNLDANRVLSPEFGDAITVIDGVRDGQIDYRDPRVAKAFDVLNPEIQLGATQGRKVSTSRLYPAPSGAPALSVGLRVEGDDQERPLTEKRSADPDDPVKEGPLDTLFARHEAARQVRNMLSDTKGRDAWIMQTIGPELTELNRKRQVKEGKMSDGTPYLQTGDGKVEFAPSKKAMAGLQDIQSGNLNGQDYIIDGRGTLHWKPSVNANGKGGRATAEQTNYAFYRDMGMPHEEALALITQGKGKPLKEQAQNYASRIMKFKQDQGESFDPVELNQQLIEQFMQSQPKPEESKQSALQKPQEQPKPFVNGSGPRAMPTGQAAPPPKGASADELVNYYKNLK